MRSESIREWITFPDPDDPATTIRADLTWLLSSWTCIFGRGCHGVVPGRAADGCCSHGAYFSGRDDQRRVKAAAAELTAEDWQAHGTTRIFAKDLLDDELQPKTRVVDGACVFLNRPGFAGGAGCALHRLALRTGRHPLETKPDVCWQLPIWCETVDGVTTVTEYDRSGWGEGGADLHWWCTDSSEAHVGAERLFMSYAPELSALLGAAAYGELARLCSQRLEGHLVLHPADPQAGRSG